MQPQTKAALAAIVQTDASLDAGARAAWLAAIEAGSVGGSDAAAPSPLLTMAEAAAVLRVSRTEFFRREQSGEIRPSHIIGTRKRYERASLLASFAVQSVRNMPEHARAWRHNPPEKTPGNRSKRAS